MDPQAKRLLRVRSLASFDIAAGLHKIVTIDAQLDALSLSEADGSAVDEMRTSQDEVIMEAITAGQLPTEVEVPA